MGEFKENEPQHNNERISSMTFGFTVAPFPPGTLSTVISLQLSPQLPSPPPPPPPLWHNPAV